MPVFRYKALTAGGEAFEGEMEARDPLTVSRKLHDLGHIPIWAEAGGSRKSGGFSWRPGRRLRRKPLAYFTAELATLLEAGLPMERALQLMTRSNADPVLRRVTRSLLQNIRGGASLSKAMEDQDPPFPKVYLGLVRAGELGGSLDRVLDRLATHLERSQAIADEIGSAMVYPLLLILMSGLAITVMMILVVPEFEPLFEESGVALPLATKIVIASSRWLGRYWWLLLLGAGGGALLMRQMLMKPALRRTWDHLTLRLPLFGPLQTKVQVASLSRTLGTLLSNGVALLPALAIVRDGVSNAAYRHSLEIVADRLKEGEPLAQLLEDTRLFPELAVELVRVGEETGQLDGMLIKLAERLDRDVRTAVQRLLALLVPGLTILLGGLIALIVASVLVALLSINQLAL